MYARSSTLAILAAVALTFPENPTPRFSLGASGAIVLNVTGEEARYGLIPTEVDGASMLTISLGATSARGALALTVRADGMPTVGRYPIATSWGQRGIARPFYASFVAGSPERPLGWFHGESGWVRITEVAPSHICGEFEIQARGFLRVKPDDENQWVTVRGTFEAWGDRSTATMASLP